ncbi:uncharacterized protein E0L32_007760 [Thyridium curvatum]|uniref:Uncharacterized protein n=1 Tax=Thyridium curvatum TaxID=1093900 RepID=A0A507B2N4_9PEZI|nr:uncharacterized protein E0L32_007760 [Thyridium curvatum]TPX11549.1 hypothetical protein E0L32_007760 [Thyridium curvatum]
METLPLHTRLLLVPAVKQDASPLFSRLPGELRSQIFAHALTDFPDPSPDRRYADETCYTRPTYFAPRRSDVALLRACRAVYAECWFLPFVLREQTHWLTAPDRAPPEYSVYMTPENLRWRLQEIREREGEQPPGGGRDVEIEGLRVFAQMYKLEEGGLARLLRTPGLLPRRLVLTIRHTDWWFWEDDTDLSFDAKWIEDVCRALPDSVREVCIELESLERKTGQVDAIAKQMCEKWFFKRKDGTALYPDCTGKSNEVSRWTGSSTWHNYQWTRDEIEPGKIAYYIVSVTFRPEHIVRRNGGSVSDQTKAAAERGVFNQGFMKLQMSEREGNDESEWSDESEEGDESEESEESDEGEESEETDGALFQ